MMPNEIRPCTLWGKTFDACEVSGVQASYHVGSKTIYSITINFWNGDRIESPQIKEVEDYTSKKVKNELNHIQALIYEALNPPVLATEAVLAGLPDEGTVDCTWEDLPKFEVQVSPNKNYDEEEEVMWIKPFYAFDEYPMGTIEGWFVYAPYYTEVGDWNMALTSVKGLKIRATNNETAEYLRQFTLDGVRIEEIDPLKGIPLFDPDVPLVQDEDEDEDFQNDITERELRGCHL